MRKSWYSVAAVLLACPVLNAQTSVPNTAVIDTVAQQPPRDLKLPAVSSTGSEKVSCTPAAGEFVFIVVVSETGEPTSVRPFVGSGMHTDACATDTVKHLHFTPGTRNGTPVAVRMYYTFTSETK